MPIIRPTTPPPSPQPSDTVDGGESGVAAVPNVGGIALDTYLGLEGGFAKVKLVNGAIALIPPSSSLYAVAVTLPAETPPVVIPASVSNAQARAALRAAGVITAVEAAIAAAADPAISDAWEYSPYISRDSALVATLGTAIGLTGGQIDALFVQAAAIQF